MTREDRIQIMAAIIMAGDMVASATEGALAEIGPDGAIERALGIEREYITEEGADAERD